MSEDLRNKIQGIVDNYKFAELDKKTAIDKLLSLISEERKKVAQHAINLFAGLHARDINHNLQFEIDASIEQMRMYLGEKK